jgi:hypothetical protein
MKNTHFSKRAQAKLAKRPQSQPKARMPGAVNVSKRPFLPRWALILLCLLVGGGGAWGAVWLVTEFVLPSRLPPELLGKWEVRGGPLSGGTFDFYRNGSMIAHLNDKNGNLAIIKAQAVVEDKRLLTTTRQPSTGQVKTSVSHIRELTPTSLVMESEEGEVTRLRRAQ